jgi:hypothetical protein
VGKARALAGPPVPDELMLPSGPRSALWGSAPVFLSRGPYNTQDLVWCLASQE